MKKWYKVIKGAEDDMSGFIQLTDKEAKLIDYVTDSNNWKACCGGGWCGSFMITPATKEEIDECCLND